MYTEVMYSLYGVGEEFCSSVLSDSPSETLDVCLHLPFFGLSIVDIKRSPYTCQDQTSNLLAFTNYMSYMVQYG